MKQFLRWSELVSVNGSSLAQGSLMTMTPSLIPLDGLCLGLGARGWSCHRRSFIGTTDRLFDALD